MALAWAAHHWKYCFREQRSLVTFAYNCAHIVPRNLVNRVVGAHFFIYCLEAEKSWSKTTPRPPALAGYGGPAARGRAGRCSSKYRSQMAGAEMARSVPVRIVPILEMRMWIACYLFLYQRSTATAFDKLSYSYRTSIAKYFDLVVTVEIYIYWPNIVSFSAHTCAGIVHPNRVNRWPEPQLTALAALAKISAPFGTWQPNSRLGRRSARACAEADFRETSGTT